MKKQNNQSIKAHLIRSALYVLLLVAVCVIPFALAQRNANNRSVAPATSRNFNPATAPPSTEADQTQPTASSGAIDVPSIVPPFPKAPQVVLYDQYDNASDSSVLCPRRSLIFRHSIPISPMISLFPQVRLGTFSRSMRMACTWARDQPTVSMSSSMPTMEVCLARKFIAR